MASSNTAFHPVLHGAYRACGVTATSTRPTDPDGDCIMDFCAKHILSIYSIYLGSLRVFHGADYICLDFNGDLSVLDLPTAFNKPKATVDLSKGVG